MSLAQLNISKGVYRYPQIENFVCVKNFLISFHNDQKYLLIRFSNETDFIVHSMEFTLTQLDGNGTVLETTKISYRNLQFLPDSTYTTRRGIIVHDLCTDFKLQFSRLTSDEYVYQVKGRQVTVLYNQPEPPLVPHLVNVEPIEEFHVQPLPLRRRKLSVLLGTAIVLLFLLLSIFQIYKQYQLPDNVANDSGYEASFLSENQKGVF